MLLVSKIFFSYHNKKTIEDISFCVENGQNVCIIGESGSGKSTLLKLIYGLENLNSGQIFFNEEEVLGPKFNLVPGFPTMKYLAQDFDLMPFITVAENVGKFLSNFYPKEKQHRIKELLELVEMSEFSKTKAKFLSGGQMQRVALARILALKPKMLLLDEPFSHIDNSRKNNLRRNIFNYAKEKNITCIVGSHDIEDALSFSDKILVIKDGEVIAEDSPKNIFRKNKNIEVAKLFGDVNIVSGSYFGLESSENILVHPFEFKIVKKSNLEIEVIKSYFKGKNYLVEAKYNDGVLFFDSDEQLNSKTKLFLALSKFSNSKL